LSRAPPSNGSAMNWDLLIRRWNRRPSRYKWTIRTDATSFPLLRDSARPIWDQDARGCIVGLTRGVNDKHIVRAVLESIAYQTADVLAVMQEDSGLTLTALKADGGAAKNNFLMQFQADIIDVAVHRPACVETTALGAAYLAGLTVGFWDSVEELRTHWKIDRVFEPSMTEEMRREKINTWKKAVTRAWTGPLKKN